LEYWVTLEIGMEERKREPQVYIQNFYLFIYFIFNLSWYATLDIFKIKNKPLATSAFSIQHLTAIIILTQV
jgi:hypothetical protein